MRIVFAFTLGLFSASSVVAQTVPEAPIEQPPGIYLGSDPTNLTRILPSRADVSEVYKVQITLDFTRSPLKVKATLPGPKSATVVKGAAPTFYFNMNPLTAAPPSKGEPRFMDALGKPFKSPFEFRLLRFTVKKGDRVADIGRLSFLGGATDSSSKVQVRFNSETLSPGKFRAWTDQPLAPGHYGFVNVIRPRDPDSDMTDESVSDTIYDFTVE